MADAAGSALAHLQYYDARMRSPEYQLTEEETRALDQFRCVVAPQQCQESGGQTLDIPSPARCGAPVGAGAACPRIALSRPGSAILRSPRSTPRLTRKLLPP